MTQKQQQKAALVAFGVGFFIEMALTGGKGVLPDLPAWALVLALGAVAFRGGRAISYNQIFVWLRDLVGIRVFPDTSGAGDSTGIPESIQGWRRTVASLVECPICSGTWVASGALFLYAVYKPMGLAIIYVLAAAGIGEVLNWLSESLEWSGRLSRERSGSLWLYKNRPEALRELDERVLSSLWAKSHETGVLFKDYADLHDWTPEKVIE